MDRVIIHRSKNGVSTERTMEGKILKPQYCSGNHGYGKIRLGGNGKKYAVHRLVALTFIPNPDNKPQVNHINGVKEDNTVENLEWVSILSNVRHAREVLKCYAGDANAMRILSEKDIPTIRSRLSNGENAGKIGNDYGVKEATILDIKWGRTWKCVK